MLEISKRLMAISDYVPEGAVLADIGTDHGLLPCYLVSTGRVPKAYAMDINNGPLSRAEEEIVNENLEDRIDTILSDGFDKLPYEVTTAVVAGMGGMLIGELITRQHEKLKDLDRLVLSPHLDSDAVRKSLHSCRWRIAEEDVVKDNNKFYPIIIAVPGKDVAYSDKDYDWGRTAIHRSPRVLEEWVNAKLDRHTKVLKRLESAGTDVDERIRELAFEIKQMEEVLRDVDDGQ